MGNDNKALGINQWQVSENEIEKLGQKLRAVDVSNQKKSSSIQEYWFQGLEKYFDVFISCEKQKIIWIQVTFRGHFLEWKTGKLISGQTNEFEKGPQKSPASKTLKTGSKLNSEFVEQMISILEESEGHNLLDQAAYILEESLESDS